MTIDYRWAEKELHMMSHFFINLVHYTEIVRADFQFNLKS